MTKKNYRRSLFYSTFSLGFFFHSLGLYYRGLTLGTFPLTNMLEILQVISWCAVFLVIIVQIAFRIRLLGFFGAALSTTIGLCSLSIYKLEGNTAGSMLNNPWIEFHAIAAIFAYGTFALLAVTSLMYLLQDRALTKKQFGGFYSLLPSLKQLDEFNERLLLIGIVSLGLSVLIGTLTWLGDTATVNYAKILVGWVILIGYLGVVLLKRKGRISLKQFARYALLLFAAALCSLWPLQV